MSIDINYETSANGVTTVNISGSMDAMGAQAIDLKFSAISGSQNKLIINFEKLDYLASMGIRTLIMGAKSVQLRNGKMVILKPNDDVQKVLSESGVDTLIPLYQDLQEAEAFVLS